MQLLADARPTRRRPIRASTVDVERRVADARGRVAGGRRGDGQTTQGQEVIQRRGERYAPDFDVAIGTFGSKYCTVTRSGRNGVALTEVAEKPRILV